MPYQEMKTLTIDGTTYEIVDNAARSNITTLQALAGAPLVANTVSAMVDTTKVYVYTGSESGYTSGNWYYWSGSAWTSGGVYNSQGIGDGTITNEKLADSTVKLEKLHSEVIAAIGSGGSGTGLTEDIKQALLQCFGYVAWINDQGQSYYETLQNALYPPASLSSITCVYTQSATVYPTTSLDSLKSDLVVTAHMTDSSTSVVASSSYALSGTLSVGTSTITVTYGGKTTTFTVTVTALPTLSSISAVYTQRSVVLTTDSLDSLKSNLVVTAHYDDSSTSTVASSAYTLSGTLAEGTSTITVSYSGKTTTFTVTIVAETKMIDGYNASNASTASSCGPYALYYNNVYTYDHTKQLTSIELNVITAGKMSILIAPLSSISDNKVTTWDNVIVKDTLYIESTGFQKVYLNERFVIPDGYILVIGGGTSSSGILDEPDTCLWKYGNYGSQKGFCWLNSNLAKSLGINVYVGG